MRVGSVKRRVRHRSGERSDAEDGHGLCGTLQLVLHTVTGGEAERLYESPGWQPVGVIPNDAYLTDGGPCDTTMFYRNLGL